MGRQVFSISLSPELSEHVEKQHEGPSGYMARLVREHMRMDEEKILKEIQALEEKLSEKKEILQLVRQQKGQVIEVETRKAEELEKKVALTVEEIRKSCPICNHPEKESIDTMIKDIRSRNDSKKAITEKWGFRPTQIVVHEQHMG